MSYSVTFIPPEEKIKKYDIQTSVWGMIRHETELITYCLKTPTVSTSSIICDLDATLSSWFANISKQVKKEAYDDWKQDGEFTYYGWEYAREADDTKEELLDRTIEDLTILTAVVQTPDYFDEQEKFYEKWNAIKEKLSFFKEEAITICRHELMEEFKEYKEKDEDSSDE